jgi:hypothetical protein
MVITTRFAGCCSSCRAQLPAGSQVEWDRYSRSIRHAPSCPAKHAEPANEEIPPGTGTCELSGRSERGCQGWTPGQVLPNTPRRIAAGEQPYLYVLQSFKKFREDGGLTYQAVCRFAAPREVERLTHLRTLEKQRPALENAQETFGTGHNGNDAEGKPCTGLQTVATGNII